MTLVAPYHPEMSKIQRLDDLLEGEGFSLAILYHQRGPSEHTLFGPFLSLVVGMEWIGRDTGNGMEWIPDCINADFCDQGRIFQHFSSSTFFSFAPFQISVIFQAFEPFFFFCKIICRILRKFVRRLEKSPKCGMVQRKKIELEKC